MVATGSRPFVPPIDGLDQVKNKFTFMTLDDAHALENALTPSSRVLIMGAGLIGLKCAEGIEGKAASITVVDLADHILPSILPRRLFRNTSNPILLSALSSGTRRRVLPKIPPF